MSNNSNNFIKLGLGIAVSGFFLYLAFRQVNLQKLFAVIADSNGAYLLIALVVLFVSHWFRAVRHRYLLEPIKRIKNTSLFSTLMIGYMANTILPAHLGEFLRAYVIGKKETIPGSSAFATIVVERIIDVISVLIIMGLVLLVYPFPNMVKLSAYLTFAFALGLVALLTLLKLKPDFTFYLLKNIFSPLPQSVANKLIVLFKSFSQGIVGLNKKKSYLIVFILSVVIWLCYAAVFAIGFYAFDFIVQYNLPLSASLVVLVIVTISIIVPSSPGYVGTYHWLCMIALGMFGVPESPALGYAIVSHAISMIPVAMVGLLFALREGIELSKIGKQDKLHELPVLE
jgi:uncharacterized protein (TIRG00374 family)